MDSALCLHNATLLTGYSVMENCAVYIKDGKIAEVYSEARFNQKQFCPKVKIINVNGAYVTPGFMDTHIHGFGGFSVDDTDYKSILKMSELLALYGVTSFIPTIGACEEAQMIARIKAIIKAKGREKGAKILGIHLEGPFLSPIRIGGQLANGISPVDMKLLKRLLKVGKGNIINMTVAPELKSMREMALYCIKEGIILQAGHTDATYQQMLEGIQVRIQHVTHMFNAMRPLHHREPGIVGAALIHPEVSCEIIGDGIHVAPPLVKLLTQSKSIDKLVLVTDALKLTKSPTSENDDYYLDKCFRRKSDDVIIGSAISMLDGIKNLVSFGVPLESAVQMASTNPAAIMKQDTKGLILPGYDADLVVFNQDFEVIHTIINGEIYKEK